jgi:hypothetical protein
MASMPAFGAIVSGHTTVNGTMTETNRGSSIVNSENLSSFGRAAVSCRLEFMATGTMYAQEHTT